MSDQAPRSWLRYLSLGMELGAAIALPTLLGEWADRRLGWAPWGVLGGFALGLGAGFYHFIRSSLKALREARADDDVADGGVGRAPGSLPHDSTQDDDQR